MAMLFTVTRPGATKTRRLFRCLALCGIAVMAFPLVGASRGGTEEQPADKEGRIYFWRDKRVASVLPDGKDLKWHSKVMLNAGGFPNVDLGTLRVSPNGQ